MVSTFGRYRVCRIAAAFGWVGPKAVCEIFVGVSREVGITLS